MKHTKSIVYIISVFVMIGCLKNKDTRSDNSVYKEIIDISNYKEVFFSGNMLKIGTPRYHYIQGEVFQIFIKNLPLPGNYRVKLNGLEVGSFTEYGDWFCERKMSSTGIKKNNIEIINLDNGDRISAEFNNEVRYLEPFMESEYGEYLIKGIPSELSISNLAVTCPYVKLKVEGGKTHKSGKGGYSVTPNNEAEKVIVTMNYNGRTYVKEFKTIDAPPPHIEFSNEVGVKCVELKPIGLFPNLKYTISSMTGFSSLENKEIHIENEPCFKDNHNIWINEIIYKIEEAEYIDTLKLN